MPTALPSDFPETHATTTRLLSLIAEKIAVRVESTSPKWVI
jgi:hypothetical protein